MRLDIQTYTCCIPLHKAVSVGNQAEKARRASWFGQVPLSSSLWHETVNSASYSPITHPLARVTYLKDMLCLSGTAYVQKDTQRWKSSAQGPLWKQASCWPAITGNQAKCTSWSGNSVFLLNRHSSNRKKDNIEITVYGNKTLWEIRLNSQEGFQKISASVCNVVGNVVVTLQLPKLGVQRQQLI